MKILAFSLREEARISGEAASFRLLEAVFAELGIALERPSMEDRAGSPTIGAIRRLAQLRKIADANAVDTLLLKIPTAAQLPAVCSATRRFRGRIIFWIDGLLWRAPASATQWWKFLTKEPLLTAARALVNNARWTRSVRRRSLEIVVSSQVQARELKPLLPRARIHIVTNGTPEQSATVARPERAFTAGYLGHAYLVKGVWEMLDALRVLQKQRVELPFRCALSGLGSAGFRRAAARQMEVLGEVDRADFFASIDLLVAPYWVAWGTQTFPNVLLEAMQHGVPALTTDLPVCRELFPGDLAHFVPSHDAPALAAALADLALGRRALPSADRLRAHFAAHYSSAHIAAGWRRILTDNADAMPDRSHD